MIDQRLLPGREAQLVLHSVHDVADAIRDMAVRGAPAIGAAAAFGMALAARSSSAKDAAGLCADLARAAEVLRAARPTAVNLGWAVDRMLAALQASLAAAGDADAARQAVLDAALALAEADVAANRAMGAYGAALLADGATVIHHCNTGALATVDYGTALGVVRAAHEAGKRIHVLVDETRPRLQGARLTTWELARLGIPHTLIVDSAAGWHLQRGGIDAVLVGADRVAANGDAANKIGTYPLAVVAREHGVPFYVVAPTSTIDAATPSGADIPIELRGAEEVTVVEGARIAPEGVAVANPAFDVTPSRFITAIVTERGVVRPPFDVGLAVALAAEAPASRHPLGATA